MRELRKLTEGTEIPINSLLTGSQTREPAVEHRRVRWVVMPVSTGVEPSRETPGSNIKERLSAESVLKAGFSVGDLAPGIIEEETVKTSCSFVA